MTDNRYPVEDLNAEYSEMDDGTMQDNVDTLAEAIVGHKIVSAEVGPIERKYSYWGSGHGLILTLDNGKKVALADTDDCCAYTALESFFLDPASVDHIIMGVGTTGGATTWHIYADFGDIMRLEVGWSSGNPFYYAYGFDIVVIDIDDEEHF